jgi:hypothetical protein
MIHEINLLPPDRRRVLSRQRIMSVANRVMRNVVFGLVVTSVCGVIIAVVLQGLAYTFSRITDVDVDQQVVRYESTRLDVMDRNRAVRNMSMLSRDRFVWSGKLRELFAIVPPGVGIGSMKGDSSENTSLSFEGRALSRNTLVVFEGRLKDLEWAAKVESPHSNLIQRVNPLYSFDIVMSGGADVQLQYDAPGGFDDAAVPVAPQEEDI